MTMTDLLNAIFVGGDTPPTTPVIELRPMQAPEVQRRSIRTANSQSDANPRVLEFEDEWLNVEMHHETLGKVVSIDSAAENDKLIIHLHNDANMNDQLEVDTHYRVLKGKLIGMVVNVSNKRY